MIEYVHRRRVRYRECDPMGRVYHTRYLDYFEEARTEALRSFGLAYRTLEEEGILMPVTAAEMQFLGGAEYDDLLAVCASFPERLRSRVEIGYEVRRAGDDAGSQSEGAGTGDGASRGALLVTGRVELCFLDRARERPVRPPDTIRQVFTRLREKRDEQSRPSA